MKSCSVGRCFGKGARDAPKGHGHARAGPLAQRGPARLLLGRTHHSRQYRRHFALALLAPPLLGLWLGLELAARAVSLSFLLLFFGAPAAPPTRAPSARCTSTSSSGSSGGGSGSAAPSSLGRSGQVVSRLSWRHSLQHPWHQRPCRLAIHQVNFILEPLGSRPRALVCHFGSFLVGLALWGRSCNDMDLASEFARGYVAGAAGICVGYPFDSGSCSRCL